MKTELQKLVHNKFFHIGILILIVFFVLLIVGGIILRYNVEGETNMPYKLSKISIISSSQGIDKKEQIEGNRWNFSINQNNDIYLYIDKNNEDENNKASSKNEVIQEINIQNIKLSKTNEKGELKAYRPDVTDSNVIFSNKDDNIIQNLTYLVDNNADMKNLKITNQGGIVAFRCSNLRYR